MDFSTFSTVFLSSVNFNCSMEFKEIIKRIMSTVNTLKSILFITPTFLCTKNCRFCYQKKLINRDRQVLTPKDLRKILRKITTKYKFSKKVRITFYGGEPFLCKELIGEYISIISEFFPLCDITILTGSYYSDRIFQTVVESIPKDLRGLVTIYFSEELKKLLKNKEEILLERFNFLKTLGIKFRIFDLVDLEILENNIVSDKLLDFLQTEKSQVIINLIYKNYTSNNIIELLKNRYYNYISTLIKISPEIFTTKKYRQGGIRFLGTKNMSRFEIYNMFFLNNLRNKELTKSFGCDKINESISIFPDSLKQGVGFCHSISFLNNRKDSQLLCSTFVSTLKERFNNKCKACRLTRICGMIPCISRELELDINYKSSSSKIFDVDFCIYKSIMDICISLYRDFFLRYNKNLSWLLDDVFTNI